MKKHIIFALLITIFCSCEYEHTEHIFRVANFDNVDYQLQYNNNNKSIDTVLEISINDDTQGFHLLTNGNEAQTLPDYTDEEFLEEIKTLKIFRISEGDTNYYGGSISYCLDKANWEYSFEEERVYGRHNYFLRLGRD